MPNKLKEIMLDEISLVDNPANQHAKVVLQKMDAGTPSDFSTKEYRDMTPEQLEKKLGDVETQNAELVTKNTDLEAVAKKYDELSVNADAIVKSAAEFGVDIDLEKGEVTKRAEPEYIEMDGEKVLKAAIPEPLLKRLETLEKAQEAESLAKRAKEELPNMVGEDLVKGELLKAVDGLDEKHREAAMQMLKGADKATSDLFKAVGSNSIDESSPEVKLDKLAKKYAEENNVDFAKAYVHVVDTAEGQALLKQAN